jgi:predicted MPP superfamily phosphohydrolase
VTVRLIGIADLHINQHSRFEEGAEIRKWMVNNLPAYEPDAYLIGGDLLHGRSTIAEREAAMRFLRALDHDAEVVGVYGNHEATNDLGIYNALPAAECLFDI